MTKSHVKQGKCSGLTPWGLLRAVLDGNAPEIAPEPAAALFRLYAHAFKGRRQLHWSVGLRAKLLPEQVELSDQQIVERPEDERAILLAELSTEQWRSIRRARAEASVLDAAESGKPVLEVVLSHIARRQSGGAVWDARDERTHGGTALSPDVLNAPLDVRLADIFRHPPPDSRRRPKSG